MIARNILPPEYSRWNQKWKAPCGPNWLHRSGQLQKFKLDLAPLTGPFAFQSNNSIRAVEYPWAFFAAEVKPGMKVLELGGALSGFQFVLSSSGLEVVNVDPFFDYGSGKYQGNPAQFHAQLNQKFHTQVKLLQTTIDHASLADKSFDRVYCISTIEHLNAEDIVTTLRHINRVLKDGGLFICTVDLFLNLIPFCTRSSNNYGTNVSVFWILEESGMKLVTGTPKELYGFPEFDTNYLLSNLDEYLIGTYPCLSQMFVFQK